MSDEKKSQGGYPKQKTNINESYMNYYDEASMIKEAPHYEEEEEESEQSYQLRRGDNKQKDAINIIDY